jgi:uncharacterized protein
VTPPPRRRVFLLVAAALAIVLVGGRWLAVETAERAWAASVAGGQVYLTARDLARLVQGVILLVSLAWGIGNLYMVYRAIGSVQLPRRLGNLEIVEAVPQPVLLAGTLLAGMAFGAVLALGTGDWWLQASLAARPPRYGIMDPVLRRDLGYYVGELPWSLTSHAYALLATSAAVVVVALLYLGIGSLHFRRWRPFASPHARLHLGVLLTALALTLTWGAVLDPAATVAGLRGALDQAALTIRVPGARLVTALGILVAIVSLGWGLREQPTLLVGGWAALLAASLAVYLVLPGILRSGSGAGADGLDPDLLGDRRRLEPVAFGAEWLEERGPPGFPTPDAAVAALPAWDAERVAAVVRRARLLGSTGAVAAAALSPHRPNEGRATWLIGVAPDLDRLARTQPPPPWTDVHRGAWARAGRALAAVEADSGLEFAPVQSGDTAAWFGEGFGEFAVAAPDSWPSLSQSGGEGAPAAGIPLAGWWRRTALAWVLQSPELARTETDGLVLLWRRDVAERLRRLAPFAAFDVPAPVMADGALWWIDYGYLGVETFPLARRLEWDRRGVRYLRAGFLGAVNAATGETRLYLAPGADALAQAWARRFAPLVRPLDSLPPSLRGQLPYPRLAFRAAVAHATRSQPDTTPWTPRPREPYELVAPGPPGPPGPQSGMGSAARPWLAQGFETGPRGEVAGLLAGAIGADGPRLFFWRPSPPTRLPGPVLGSPQTAPGVLRLWLAGGALVSEQALFAQAATDGEPPRLLQSYVTWGDGAGAGPTPALALRDLFATAPSRTGRDTSLTARWDAARRLAAQADAALAAGDLEAFGRLYDQLKQLLGAGRRKLAAPPGPR